jgi:hypothetical protein
MPLPADWSSLNPAEQLFVATNLERVDRGLPPMSEMASALDQASASAAALDQDPTPPSGFDATKWTSNWAGGVGSPLEAIYFWMYDDGPGSPNVDCHGAGDPGCWAHRDDILASFACSPCVMGSAVVATSSNGSPSMAELLADTSGDPPEDATWAQADS